MLRVRDLRNTTLAPGAAAPGVTSSSSAAYASLSVASLQDLRNNEQSCNVQYRLLLNNSDVVIWMCVCLPADDVAARLLRAECVCSNSSVIHTHVSHQVGAVIKAHPHAGGHRGQSVVFTGSVTERTHHLTLTQSTCTHLQQHAHTHTREGQRLK